MLQIKKISFSVLKRKFFSKSETKTILNEISIDIDSADSPLAILGPSGSGKSTFLRCINFLEEFQKGEILFDNQNITQKNINLFRKNFGFVFQESGLFPNMTVMENICYSPINIYKQDRKKIETQCIKMLKEFEIDHIKDSYPQNISGGEKQKTAIVRSLILEPKILFFDEPTSALDKKSAYALEKIIKSISNTIIVIVTHDTFFAKKVAKKICKFSNSGQLSKIANNHPKTGYQNNKFVNQNPAKIDKMQFNSKFNKNTINIGKNISINTNKDESFVMSRNTEFRFSKENTRRFEKNLGYTSNSKEILLAKKQQSNIINK
jgi:ABC-type polar amino acid transport system ATPase subunit